MMVHHEYPSQNFPNQGLLHMLRDTWTISSESYREARMRAFRLNITNLKNHNVFPPVNAKDVELHDPTLIIKINKGYV